MVDKEIIRETYKGLDTEELIDIANNLYDEYEEEAVEIARAELRSRGIIKIPKRSPPPLEENEVGDDTNRQLQATPDSKTKVIWIFGDEMHAEMARQNLEAKNIPSFITRDDCGGWRPWFQPITGVRLVVNESDAEAAEEILSKIELDNTT